MPSWRYVCPYCGHLEQPDTRFWKCPNDGAPFQLAHESQQLYTGANREDQTIRRYLDLLPVTDDFLNTLGAGMTPLVEGHLAGRPVYFKLDSQLPTGSFKDRGAAVLVAVLKENGVQRAIVDSSGNAAAAMAAYCAAAGIACTVFAPAEASRGKLVQARAYGAMVMLVEGGREAVAEAAQSAAESDASGYYATHNWSPVFAEGVKTWALETYEQLGESLPDAVFVPTGGGSAFAGAYLGFSAVDSRLPRLVAAQPSACDPVVTAFQAGRLEVEAVIPEPTLAEGARIAAPPRGNQLLNILNETGGWATSVSEPQLIAALKDLWTQGLYVEPTSALGAVACIDAINTNAVSESDVLVVHLTGSGLKATDTINAILSLSANG